MHKLRLLISCVILSLAVALPAQTTTSVSGVVYDSQTGEPVSFAQIFFKGSTIGTTSDIDGNFSLHNTQGYKVVEFRMMGYKTVTLTLREGADKKNAKVYMEPDTYLLDDVVIKPEKTAKEKYKRKGNPAVELIKNVIAHKSDSRVVSEDAYKYTKYDKLTLSLDPFDYDLNKNRFWRDFKFLEEYVDTMYLERGVLVVDSGKVNVDSVSIGKDSVQVNVDSVVLIRNAEEAAKQQDAVFNRYSFP